MGSFQSPLLNNKKINKRWQSEWDHWRDGESELRDCFCVNIRKEACFLQLLKLYLSKRFIWKWKYYFMLKLFKFCYLIIHWLILNKLTNYFNKPSEITIINIRIDFVSKHEILLRMNEEMRKETLFIEHKMNTSCSQMDYFINFPMDSARWWLLPFRSSTWDSEKLASDHTDTGRTKICTSLFQCKLSVFTVWHVLGLCNWSSEWK